jgi:hypothetical protein
MKKNLLILALAGISLIPCLVDAKNYCRVVEGNGKDIGSEIACGDEHFYVISSNKNEIKMLSKYNLNTGISIYKEKIPDGYTEEEQYAYCRDLAESNHAYLKSDQFYYDPGYCFYAKLIDDSIIKQSEEAKSAHWDENGNYLYPQIGDVYMTNNNKPNYVVEVLHDSEDPVIPNTSFYDFTIDTSVLDDTYSPVNYYPSDPQYPRNIQNRMYRYQLYLNSGDYNVKDISLLSLSQLYDIIYSVSNNKLPLKDWSDNFVIINQDQYYNYIVEFGYIKPYIPEKYSWLYSSTYWNSTVFKHESTYHGRYNVFTNQEGKICGAGFASCAPTTAIGCGVRPVITIPNELLYSIRVNNNGIGNVEIVSDSLSNQLITFKINSTNTSKLDKIIITTDSGLSVSYEEGDIIYNNDGTVSINNNSFIMPEENITIELIWNGMVKGVDENPKTGVQTCELILLMLLSIGTFTFAIVNKKQKRLFNN